MDAMLEAEGLRFLDLIDYPPIKVAKAQATFLSGESGSGKSKLCRLFNATSSPTAGTILYQGIDIQSMDTIELRKEIVLASQSVFLFEGSIRANFNRFYDFRETEPINDDKQRAFLRICCMDFPLETKCETMSGGERQRVFLAIYLSLMPKLLMLDEPTSALDESTADQLLMQIKDYCMEKQITLLVICHDKKLTDAYADKVITLTKRANR